ncbi:hypothetical protein NSK11_contig00015-0034 [Nocardia seriolae]|uniref:Uncharacterized protein n=1 Tax=Nocardia seriolae TaxID=37332 RepID=A0ABC9YPC5_9NOCA|nr:hypothetical protein NSERKGN1266_57900 [Nocardia seriolae]BEK94545.1 hypothetical protein NSER024013_24510 [Nocardia seriolae]GAM45171.1 hypothetical protein NS07_v2contig00012-0033 [Nocardia seriolae]GAP27193.1 hypothetical protein NSK11_contig00015-0034 [Nocardia seriolae]GEM23012.1 hypothetical protein NS2_12510 [Nocardia seriolae NBRC 15557]
MRLMGGGLIAVWGGAGLIRKRWRRIRTATGRTGVPVRVGDGGIVVGRIPARRGSAATGMTPRSPRLPGAVGGDVGARVRDRSRPERRVCRAVEPRRRRRMFACAC